MSVDSRSYNLGEVALPNPSELCSNRSMRKWQRDRMRRRKKSPGPSQKASDQPEPLQPAYPDMDRPLQSSEPEPPPEPELEAFSAPAEGAQQLPDRTRRRRRR